MYPCQAKDKIVLKKLCHIDHKILSDPKDPRINEAPKEPPLQARDNPLQGNSVTIGNFNALFLSN